MAEPAKPEVAFDTLQTAEDLKSAGMDERHAKAIATAMRDAIASGTVTRTDLAEFKGETKADFVGVENLADGDNRRIPHHGNHRALLLITNRHQAPCTPFW